MQWVNDLFLRDGAQKNINGQQQSREHKCIYSIVMTAKFVCAVVDRPHDGCERDEDAFQIIIY